MTKIILLSGAPGTGKTTISKMLHEKLNDSVYLELSWLRCYHLNKTWSNASPEEEEMSFDNLVYILKNYIKNQYPFVIINDLEDRRVLEFPSLFPQAQLLIFSLFVNDEGELKDRVLNETRDSGYRNFDEAIKWNRRLIKRNAAPNEFKIDNTDSHPDKALEIIMQKLCP